MANRVLHYNWNMLYAYFRGMSTDNAKLFAWFGEAVDRSTPETIAKYHGKDTCDKLVMQVRWKGSGAILLATNDYWWEEFRNVAFFHFGGKHALQCVPCPIGAMMAEFLAAFGRALATNSVHNIAKAAILKHIVDDSVPHRGFYGFPHPGNVATAFCRAGGATWWQSLFPAKEAWGHVFAPQLDEVQHYAKDLIAVYTAAGCDVALAPFGVLRRVRNDDNLEGVCDQLAVNLIGVSMNDLDFVWKPELAPILWRAGRELMQ